MTRFPTYPTDILSRADALLSSKYPDGIVDPRFVEVACEAIMAERAAAENAGSGPLETLRAIAEGNLGDDPWQANYEKIRAVAKAGIAKAIRGTGQPPAPSPARDE